ncbi:hypothetical protein [Curvivirga sp.]|uniref:hypothetical protein n=1 Tax=Curvivirga sp. TaxID=2856848 RepID=UPI003B5C9735
MLRHLSFLLVIVASIASSSARTEPVKLKADEIFSLLNGQKIKGEWNGMSYTQHFYTNGVTIYISGDQNGTRSEHGKWQVNKYKDAYESSWGSPRWSAYDVMRDGDKYYWSDIVGTLREFRVIGD